MSLADPARLGDVEVPNRLVFGPHETNLGRGRSFSDRHVAYYLRRARGGAGMIITEEASVHDSDWPYERAPLASQCAEGWRMIADAVHSVDTGPVVLAALGHAGGQGSTAYSQMPLWAPSRVPEVNTREVPKWMEDDDIQAVINGFGAAARTAVASGMDGVEVNAGQYSLIRQFLSGLTNLRDDEWGTDRLRFAKQALAATRAGVDAGAPGRPARLVGLRLSCDELAPWAGLTPETAAEVSVALAPLVDYLVVVRGSIFTTSATRPDFHEPEGFNLELCALIRKALRGAGIDTPVVLQGSVVEPRMAEHALTEQRCDLVEMTRAQIADAALGAKVSAGEYDQIRPCVRCNQMCMVRDPRNPIVSCVGDPSSGHELDDPAPLPDGPMEPTEADREGVLVVGGGPAGLEAARTAAALGHRARLVDAGVELGMRNRFPVKGSGNPELARLAGWLESECRRLGVEIETGRRVDVDEVTAAVEAGFVPVLATGSVNGVPEVDLAESAHERIISAADLCAHWARESTSGEPRFPGEAELGDDETIVVLDPAGAQVGVALAEALSRRPGATVHLVTQDHLAANELARTGDLAPANARLQQAGVIIERRTIPRSVGACDGTGRVPIVLEDRFSGQRRTLDATWIVDAGFRLPDESLWRTTGSQHLRAGDCVAPRSVHEAMLEGRRAAVAVHRRGR